MRKSAPALSSASPQAPTPASVQADQAADAWAALAAVVAGGGVAAGRVRVSRDGGRSYPRSRERTLTSEVPDQPAAVRLYDTNGDARCLVADLDVKRGGQQQVDRDLACLLVLIERCGGRAFTDSSPTGGRHVYLPLEQPVHYDQLRPVAHALAVLLPSLDVAPAVNIAAGCLRPPGARHKTGGWQILDGPLPRAEAVARRPNAPSVWAALLDELRPQLTAQQPARTDPTVTMPPEAAGAAGPKERLAAQAPPALAGGPRRLRTAATVTARTGSYDPDRYASPSQARQSVLAAAAASGWSFNDVLEQLHEGRWPGLWGFYRRYPDRHRREALAGDWLAALRYARTTTPADQQGQNHVRNPDTRAPTTHRGGPPPSLPATNKVRATEDGLGLPAGGYQYLRAWWTAVRLGERERYLGRAGQSRRLVLRALGAAGQKTCRSHLAFGVRSLAIATGLSRTTVATELRALREEDDSFLTLIVAGRGLAGDLYELRVPDAYLERARTDAWRAGRIEALLPAFRVLGTPAAFVYEVLDNSPQTSWDLAVVALLSVRSTQQALAELAAHGLATRDAHGWSRGPADPTDVARAVGADHLVRDQVQRYQRERAAWRTRLGAHPGPSIEELLATPAGPIEPPTADLRDWLATQTHPPPTGSRLAEAAALELVLQLLGGVVLQTSNP